MVLFIHRNYLYVFYKFIFSLWICYLASNTYPNFDIQNRKDVFKFYRINDINDFLSINDKEVLIEKIPDYLIISPIFSIIIPIYNNKKTIKRTIRSIQNQNFKSLEIILVDDGSTDNSIEIIENLAKIDKRLKIVKKKEKSGNFISRINGIKLSKGEFIVFLDSDDMLALSNVLESLNNISMKYKVDVIEFNSINGNIGKYEGIIEIINSRNLYKKIIYGKNIIASRYLVKNRIERNPSGAVWNKIVKISLINKILNYLQETGINKLKNWNYAEDQFLSDLIRIFSNTYLHLNKIYHFYYKNNESLTRKCEPHKLLQDHIKYINHFYRLTNKFQLNIEFLICNIKNFLSLNLKNNKNECEQVFKLISEMKIDVNVLSNYGHLNYKNFIKDCFFYCKK